MCPGPHTRSLGGREAVLEGTSGVLYTGGEEQACPAPLCPEPPKFINVGSVRIPRHCGGKKSVKEGRGTVCLISHSWSSEGVSEPGPPFLASPASPTGTTYIQRSNSVCGLYHKEPNSASS